MMHADKKPIHSSKCEQISGEIHVPGDKSISHRSLMIASQAIGTSYITGLLEGDDVLRTAQALRQMGVAITTAAPGEYQIQGVGVGGLKEADGTLDLGNSGTGVRLLMGLVAPYSFVTSFTGDESLCKRPMKRIVEPLSKMGVLCDTQEGGRLPLAVNGSEQTIPVTYELPVPSAQVKSAVLFAGLNTAGKTSVIEKEPTRDHTERMFRCFGADVEESTTENGATLITLTGQPELKAQRFAVPGDPSSAAFLAVAALIIPGSELLIQNVCMNPTRTGLFTTLIEMGADITYQNEKMSAGEPVADILVRASELQGVEVPAERAPSMIDEYPILSVAAACASGTTVMHGLEELKVKESNRLQAIYDGLIANGIKAEMGDDTLTVEGAPGAIPGGGTVATHFDHRIAMSFLVLGAVSQQPVTVDDGEMIKTSFPSFVDLANQCGMGISTRD